MTGLSRDGSNGLSRDGGLSGLSSPPSSLSRQPSDVSLPSTSGQTARGGSPSVGGTKARVASGRHRLRDYYGLAQPKGDPLDIDSPGSFNPDTYFESLANNQSLPELLKRENELLTEIRELDGERQSLVYNHHHELIEASDTIRKMKSRALALDASLDSLKASFESISQLSAALAPQPATPTTARPTDTSDHSIPRQSTPTKRPLSTLIESPTAATSAGDYPTLPTLDPLAHIPALLSLPTILKALLLPAGSTGPPASEDRQKADALWGTWEPALRSWEDEGVEGVKDLGNECREVLKEGRRRSSSNPPSAVLNL